MLPRHAFPIISAALALSLSAASASALGFLKKYAGTVADTSLPSTDVVADAVDLNDPNLSPVFVVSQGLGITTDPSGDPLSNLGPTPSFASADANHYTVEYKDPEDQTTRSFFDIFTDISLPTSGGDPSSNPAVILVDHPPTITSNTITFSSIISVDGLEHSHETIIDIPAGQGFTFGTNTSVALTPITTDPTGQTFSSFFDIFVELDAAPNTTFDPSLPLFEVSESIDTPEPASLSLLACAAPILLTRQKRRH